MFGDSYSRVTGLLTLLALVLTGCGDDGDQAATTTTAPTIEVDLVLSTSTGLIGGNIDDVSCEWGPMSYEVVDRNEDDVLDLGDIPGAGRVVSVMPDYECQAEATLEVASADFYEITVEGVGMDGPWSATETFALDEVEAGPVAIAVDY